MLFKLKKSNYSAAILLGAHLGAVGIALGLPFGIGLRMVLTAVVAASLGWQWKRLGSWREGEWRVDDDGGCSWFPEGNDKPVRYELLQAERGTLWIRLLIERYPKQRCHLFIWKDAVDAETYRELHARIEQRRLPARYNERF